MAYEAYPKVYTPPLHFSDPGKSDGYASSSVLLSGRELDAVYRQLQRVLAYNEVENLQNAYGYYAEKSLWTDIAGLFTDDGILESDAAKYTGRASILDFLKANGLV